MAGRGVQRLSRAVDALIDAGDSVVLGRRFAGRGDGAVSLPPSRSGKCGDLRRQGRPWSGFADKAEALEAAGLSE